MTDQERERLEAANRELMAKRDATGTNGRVKGGKEALLDKLREMAEYARTHPPPAESPDSEDAPRPPGPPEITAEQFLALIEAHYGEHERPAMRLSVLEWARAAEHALSKVWPVLLRLYSDRYGGVPDVAACEQAAATFDDRDRWGVRRGWRDVLLPPRKTRRNLSAASRRPAEGQRRRDRRLLPWHGLKEGA